MDSIDKQILNIIQKDFPDPSDRQGEPIREGGSCGTRTNGG